MGRSNATKTILLVLFVQLNFVFGLAIPTIPTIVWSMVFKTAMEQGVKYLFPEDLKDIAKIAEGVVHPLQDSLEKGFTELKCGDDENARIVDISNANIQIEDMWKDFENMRNAGDEVDTRATFEQYFVKMYEEKQVAVHVAYISGVLTKDSFGSKPVLDIFAEKYRCDVKKFEKMKDSFLLLLYHALYLQIQYIKLSIPNCLEKKGCVLLVDTKKKDSMDLLSEVEEAISQKIDNCRHLSAIHPYIAEDVTLYETSQQLGNELSTRYQHIWIIITFLHDTQEVYSTDTEPSSRIIRDKNKVVMYGSKSESLNEKDLNSLKDLVRTIISESKCLQNHVLETCANVLKEGLGKQGFALKSFFGQIHQNELKEKVEEFNKPKSNGVTVETSTVTRWQCKTNYNQICRFDVFGVLGDDHQYWSQIIIHVTKLENIDENETKED